MATRFLRKSSVLMDSVRTITALQMDVLATLELMQRNQHRLACTIEAIALDCEANRVLLGRLLAERCDEELSQRAHDRLDMLTQSDFHLEQHQAECR